jgi:hypothetical protein
VLIPPCLVFPVFKDSRSLRPNDPGHYTSLFMTRAFLVFPPLIGDFAIE